MVRLEADAMITDLVLYRLKTMASPDINEWATSCTIQVNNQSLTWDQARQLHHELMEKVGNRICLAIDGGGEAGDILQRNCSRSCVSAREPMT